ncbi:hypothetical protein Y032_0006g3033 [Ancylostoma ceylanicum]|uniref:MADF domain-containing protein n=1 Tax=Ancylostoma ceylanicum TaxID=53326 RepID=A0A016VPT2_9BILA|nr:hypothetical protein Y032_0006g3033 [Ancylostoma ceylanicum]
MAWSLAEFKDDSLALITHTAQLCTSTILLEHFTAFLNEFQAIPCLDDSLIDGKFQPFTNYVLKRYNDRVRGGRQLISHSSLLLFIVGFVRALFKSLSHSFPSQVVDCAQWICCILFCLRVLSFARVFLPILAHQFFQKHELQETRPSFPTHISNFLLELRLMTLHHELLPDFVKAIQIHPEVYENYNTKESEKAWEVIADLFEITVSDAKKQWLELVRIHRYMYLDLPDEAFKVLAPKEDPRWHAATRQTAITLAHFLQNDLKFLFKNESVI